MPKFSIGDLVIATGEYDRDYYDVMTVTNYEDGFYTLRSEKQGVDCTFNDEELKLVRTADDIIREDMKQLEATKSTRTVDEVHQDISDMIAQVANYMIDNLDGESCRLSIEAEFSTGTNVDVEFKARVRYGDDVVSDDLYKSARIALERHSQNETLKPRRITLYREAAE